MDNAAPPQDPGHQSPGSQHPTPPDGGPRVDASQMRDLSTLRRSTTDRHVAGVAGGLAKHFDVDPVIVRVCLVVLALFGGSGLLLYLVLWALLPEEGTVARPLGLDDRSRTVAVVIGGGVAALALLSVVTGSGNGLWFLWPVAIVVAVVMVLSNRSNRRPIVPPYGTPGAPTGPGWGPTYGPEPDPATSTAAFTSPYGPPAGPPYGHEWAPVPPPQPTYVRPPNPRRRGPILFGFALALIATAVGILGLVDVAGTDVANSAYPALALGVTALMLVVGSFWGRAGGLIALGLALTLALGVTTAVERFDTDDIRFVPTSAAQVSDSYDMHAGEFVLDLREVGDLDALDGRDVHIEAGVGRVLVLVPEGLDVDATADVGVGDSLLFGQRTSGVDTTQSSGQDRPGRPELSLSIDLGVGDVVVANR